jgi:sugar phosphate isomerase/epimerase
MNSAAPLISRRSLLEGAILTSTAASLASAAPFGWPVGTQTYPVRTKLGKDFDGTLKELASTGFQSIEMCSPQGYAGPFAPLASIKPEELRSRIKAAGLQCESCHYTRKELNENLAERIDYAKALGLKYMVLSSFSIREGSLADWARAATELNKVAEQISKAGIQTAFHNHDREFEKRDGELIYDRIMRELDPKLVKMQYQVVVGRLGVDYAEVFNKYPGRFVSLHLDDWKADDKKPAALGTGAVNWKKLMQDAKKAGVKNYFVEVEPDAMKESCRYMQGLKA